MIEDASVAMRKPYKHKFRLRLFRSGYRGSEFGPWMTVSIRIDRSCPNAVQRVLRRMNAGAPDGWRYVTD